jgi:TolB-like protein
MVSSKEEKGPSKRAPSSPLKAFLAKLRKRRIIETLAAFIGGGWLIIEFVDRILVAHYHFPDKTIDITFITLLCALLCTLIWRWFSGREKPRKFKLELVLIPLVVLIAVLLDINLLLHLKNPESETFPAANWKNSIAVLPFVDMSPQKDQEYFCDGMTEELINRLSNVKELKVPARTSAFMFKGKAEDIREIGRKLDVRTVLEGSIRKVGNQLRVTAQLINIADGYHLWSDTYDRKLNDVFAIQDEISSAIVESLRLKLTIQEKLRMSGHSIDNVAAYECYLRARREISRYSEDALDRALQDLQNGLQIMGDNALLYSGMAWAYFRYVDIGVGQEEFITRSEEYAKKALALDPDVPEAYHALAMLSIYKNYPENFHSFFRNAKLALALDPNLPNALLSLADIYILLGKPTNVPPLMDRFKQVDPLSPDVYSLNGESYLFDGQYQLAVEQFRQGCRVDPNPWYQFFNAWALAYNKEIDEALSIIDQSAKATPNLFTKFGLLLKYALLKDRGKAFQVMTAGFQKTCRRDFEWSYYVASMLSLLDSKTEALDWLKNAVNRGFINYPLLAEKDIFLANIRGEPRFKKLMERVKYEWEHFEE